MLETRDLDDLERIIVRMIRAYPFFGCLMARLPKRFSTAIDTAAVCWDNQLAKFWLEINEKFFSALPDEQKIGLLTHEAMHIVNMHVQRNRDDLLNSSKVIQNSSSYTKTECEQQIVNHALFNIACDYAINQLIHNDGERYRYNNIEVELPKSYDEKGGETVSGITTDAMTRMCKPGTNIERNQTAEYYYNLLKENISDDIKQQGGSFVLPCKSDGDGSGGGSSSDGDGDKDKSADSNGNEQGNGKNDRIGTIDDHSRLFPGGKTPAQTESSGSKAVNEAARLVKGARQDAQMRKAGSIPGAIEDMIKDLLEATVDWRHLLRNSFGSRLTVEKEVTYNRRDRRTRLVPSFKKASKENIVIAIDTSGSISEGDLKKYFTEIEALLRESNDTEAWLAQIDTRICSFEKYSAGDWKKIKVNGGGGTDMLPIFEAAAKHVVKCPSSSGEEEETQIDVDRLILFTDGYWSRDEVPTKHTHGYQITLVYTKNNSRVTSLEERHNVSAAVMQ